MFYASDFFSLIHKSDNKFVKSELCFWFTLLILFSIENLKYTLFGGLSKNEFLKS